MTRLLGVEARRYLARRLTRVLIGLGLLVSAIAGIVVFAQNEKQTAEVVADNQARREANVAACVSHSTRGGFDPRGPVEGPEGGPPVNLDPATAERFCRQGMGDADQSLRLTDLWPEGGGEAMLAVTSIFLGIGALIGGASMVGAEWKANTFTTTLTWEPRRARVAVAKIVAAGLLATLVAIVLQLAFTAALLPAILVKGTTEGADAAWLGTAVGGLVRSGLLAGFGAVVGSSIAMIGRSTSAALGVAFAYLAVVEAVVRARRPNFARWLVGENSTIFLTGRRLGSAPFERSPSVATLTLLAFAIAIVVLAAVSLRRRDVAA